MRGRWFLHGPSGEILRWLAVGPPALLPTVEDHRAQVAAMFALEANDLTAIELDVADDDAEAVDGWRAAIQTASVEIDGDTYDVQDAPAPPVVVPAQVTRYQAKIALINLGMFGAITALMNSEPATSELRVAWETAAFFPRTGTLMTAFKSLANLSDADIDEVFVAAGQVPQS